MIMTVKERQKHLKRHGYYAGRIDGLNGPKTKAATIAFKKSRGLKARDYVGPITATALRTGGRPYRAKTRTDGGKVDVPEWLRLASTYLGLREIKGRRHNAKILSMWERLSLPFNDDETPWCAGFANAMVLDAGLPIVRKNRAAALGWRWNGYGLRLPGPALGAIMSMERPGKPGSGHMTFVAGRDWRGRIMGLGGNQGDMVSINPYDPTARNAQYHFPEGVAGPSKVGMHALPLISSDGVMLENEA